MRVDQQRSLLGVPGEVDLEHALRRDRGEVALWIEAVVVRADEDVVHVEQDPAVRTLEDAHQELPLGHRVGLVGEI